MAENLKDIYTDEVILDIGETIYKVYKKFDRNKFFNLVKQNDFESLKLKQRFDRLAESLYITLDLPFEEVCKILIELNDYCKGFKYMFLPEVVSKYGLNHFDCSMKTLEVLTSGSSAEFAIRDFLNNNFDETFEVIKRWSKSLNEHVRRLSSEGIRTKLPWGKKVNELYNHPLEIIEVLENLKEDSSLYVRKSVANNLNDLSKDFPFLTFKVFRNWKGKNEKTDWIIKTGARTSIKNGNKYVLDLFDYSSDISISSIKFSADKKEYYINDVAQFNYSFDVKSNVKSKIRVSLLFEFKNKTSYTKKVFFLKEDYVDGIKHFSGLKNYAFKDMTIRKHYKGIQYITLQINSKDYKKIKVKII